MPDELKNQSSEDYKKSKEALELENLRLENRNKELNLKYHWVIIALKYIAALVPVLTTIVGAAILIVNGYFGKEKQLLELKKANLQHEINVFDTVKTKLEDSVKTLRDSVNYYALNISELESKYQDKIILIDSLTKAYNNAAIKIVGDQDEKLKKMKILLEEQIKSTTECKLNSSKQKREIHAYYQKILLQLYGSLVYTPETQSQQDFIEDKLSNDSIALYFLTKGMDSPMFTKTWSISLDKNTRIPLMKPKLKELFKSLNWYVSSFEEYNNLLIVDAYPIEPLAARPEYITQKLISKGFKASLK